MLMHFSRIYHEITTDFLHVRYSGQPKIISGGVPLFVLFLSLE